MKDGRLRIPIDDPYLLAVGLAVICFTRLEWGAVWCCEKIQPGYLQTVGAKTAGQIAKDLVALSITHPNPSVAASLSVAAVRFRNLVRQRNDLLHANPGTVPNGDQRLFRRGAEWTISMVNDISDEFAEADVTLNHHFHNLL